jgi:hypothetical protein
MACLPLLRITPVSGAALMQRGNPVTAAAWGKVEGEADLQGRRTVEGFK